MKKIVSAVVLSAAVVATAGQALAYAPNDFGNFSLTMGMYDVAGKVEIGRSLGTITNTFGYGNPSVNLTLNETNLSLGTVDYQALATAKGANSNDLLVGMFSGAMDGVSWSEPAWDIYFATTKNTAPNEGPSISYMSSMWEAASAVNWIYNNQDTDNDGIMSMAGGNALGYAAYMDNNSPGSYSGSNNDFSKGNVKIGNIVGEYQDFYLYHYHVQVAENPTDYEPYLVKGTTGTDYTAVLRFTKANGEVILNPTAAPVPVPAAAWLLGSGLLGLVGLRRRNA